MGRFKRRPTPAAASPSVERIGVMEGTRVQEAHVVPDRAADAVDDREGQLEIGVGHGVAAERLVVDSRSGRCRDCRNRGRSANHRGRSGRRAAPRCCCRNNRPRPWRRRSSGSCRRAAGCISARRPGICRCWSGPRSGPPANSAEKSACMPWRESSTLSRVS